MGLKVDRSIYIIEAGFSTYGEVKGTFTTHDIVKYTFFRLPFIKPCPIVSLELDLDYKFYIDLVKEHGANNYPKCTVSIFKGEENKQDPTNHRRVVPKELISTNEFYIHNIITSKQSTESNQVIRIKLLMTETLYKILWHMNGLNKAVQNMKAIDMLQDYNSYLFDNFNGSNTFDALMWLPDNPSSYIYRRHQYKAANDLILPTHIIMNMKPVDGLSYYFLDSFKVDGRANKRVTRMFIELTNYDKFQSYDVTQNGHEDIAIGSPIRMKTIQDTEDRFEMKGDYAKVLSDWKGRYQQYVPTQTMDVDVFNSGNARGYKNEGHPGGRGGPIERFHGIWANSMMKTTTHKEGLTWYAPDSYDLAMSRYDLLKNFYRKTIESFVIHEFPEVHPSAILFDNKYNLDIKSHWDYKYVPIGIVNEFKKWNMHEANYKHTAYVNFLKYI